MRNALKVKALTILIVLPICRRLSLDVKSKKLLTWLIIRITKATMPMSTIRLLCSGVIVAFQAF
jgi:hypothetical protein